MSTITIAGKILYQNGIAVPAGILVAANERQLRLTPTLAEVTTTGKGAYSLTLHDVADRTSYYIEVRNGQGETLATEGPFSVLAGNRKLDVIIDNAFFAGDPVFKIREPVLKKYVDDWRQGGADNPVTAEDARFVAAQTGEDAGETWRWMKAHQLEVETTSGTKKMPAEMLYGLLKQGLPGSIAALSALPSGDIAHTLKQAMDANQISKTVPVGDLMKDWKELLGSQSLSEKPEGLDASLGEILSMAGATASNQKKMMALFSEHTGSDEAYWNKLAEIIPGENKVARFRKAMQLAAFTGFQPRMLDALMQENTQGNTHAVAALAGKDEEDWKAFIQAASTQGSAVPSFIKGSNEAERIAQYAAVLAETTEKAFPTASFFKRLSKLESTSGGFVPARADLQAFYEKNPDFDFKKASLTALADGTGLNLDGITNTPELLKEISAARRLSVLTSRPTALQSMRAGGLDSAQAAAKMPRSQFVEKHGNAFGSAREAELAHQQAETKALQSIALWSALHPNQHIATAATNGPNEALLTQNATLRSLFGSLEACDVEHCLSLYSPAAYLADLLHFLESRSQSAYDELVRRRPGLPGLLLNCENTNTPLPYIDLVIELLEDLVIKLQGDLAPPPPPPSDYQTTLTAAELAANPENSNPAAYDVLKNAVYPSSLPFDFPLEESRVYLSHLGLTRHRLMACFFPGKEYMAFDNQAIGIEYLGISAQESNIITGQTAGAGENSGIWNFFGFDRPTGFLPISDPSGSGNLLTSPEDNWLNVLSGRVDVFLQQTGLRYVELLTLLSCHFINPENAKITIVAAPGKAPDTCQLHELQLNGLDENHLVRMHRFLRLSRCLNWRFYDLDKALQSMSISGFNNDGTPKAITGYLNNGHLRRLSQMEQLRRRFGCTVEETLAIWFNLWAKPYTDFEQDKPVPVPALYEQLFRNKAVLNPLNDAFKTAPADLSGSLDSQAASIQAALQISDADYQLLRTTGKVAADGKLRLNNLSALYRHVMLARWTGLSLADLLTVIALSETNPFAHPGETSIFLWKVGFIPSSGFSIAELDYLLRGRFTESAGLAPSKEAIQVFLDEMKALVESTETKDIPEQVETLKKNVTQKFAAAFGLSAKAADLLLNKHLKSISSPALAMVQDFLTPDTADEVRALDYRKLGKVAFLIQKFKISDEELEQILANHSEIGCLDVNALPVAPQENADWAGFEALVNLIRARDLLSFGANGLFEVLRNAMADHTDKKGWLDNLARLSNWEAETLETLIGNDTVLTSGGMLKTQFPDDFRNGDLILRIKKSMDALHTAGLNATAIDDIISPEVTSATALATKQAVKAKYDEAQWSKIAKPLRDVLREKQRATLVDYSVNHSTLWQSTEKLYEYLLIDVEMKPVAMTSRLKQAICSVQLFVDRALMNLERNDGTPVLLDAEQAEEWKTWRKIYRVWEANRKIFLYPENWIEPELRDGQTPFFKDAVSALLQNELTPETVEDAFRGYLEKLDEVARLEIVGMVHQKEEEEENQAAIDILHVFGRTCIQPHNYFYRTFEKKKWSHWQKVETDIDSDHLVPVIFNRRLCLFWLFFTPGAVEGTTIDPNKELPKTTMYWKIQVAWSEFRKNTWTGKKLSKSYFHSESTDDKSILENLRKGLFVRHYQDSGLLFIHLSQGLNHTAGQGSFVFENTASEPKTVPDSLPAEYSLLAPGFTRFEDEQIKGISLSSQPLSLRYEAASTTGNANKRAGELVLRKTAHPRFSLVVDSGASQPFEQPFVFQDRKNTFLVEPSRSSKGYLLPDVPDIFVMEQGAEQVWGKELQPASGSIKRIEDDEPEQRSKGIVVADLPKNDIQISTPDKLALQISEAYPPSPDPFRRIRHQYQFSTFYHPQVKAFVRELNRAGVPGILQRRVQQAGDVISFQQYQPTPAVIGGPPQGIVDFTYGSPYAQYNWELFFHLPIHIACRLSADQRFDEARKWFHYVFNPTTGEEGGKERFWQFKPFFEEAETLVDLQENQAELEKQIENWAANPFQPHVIARMRITAYMKFTVMKYIDNLIAWGDQLFRRDTIESINEATNLYILAAKILGPAPQRVPARVQREDKAYSDLTGHLDAFSNALVDIEMFLSPSGPSDGAIRSGASSALSPMLYFGVPRNEYLLRYWETVADRLFKIRHSLNIEGLARSLPLFEPPIDPALLVRATAAGVDLGSLLNDISVGIPHYRFAFMLQKAYELANEVKGLGALLLSALEKKDAEHLSLLRSGHEQHLLGAVLQVRERQVEEAKELLAGTKKSLESAKLRFGYYSSRKNINKHENEYLKNTVKAQGLSFLQGEYNTMASVLSGIPELKVGAPTTAGTEFGGIHLSAIYSGLSSAVGIAVGLANSRANINSTLGSYERRKDDWEFQADQAKIDIEQLEKQVLASEIRLAISQRERSNHQLQMEQSAETDQFMRGKFTNEQLFDWMAKQLSELYFQTYQFAYDLAKKAELCFQLELPQESTSSAGYINFGYWDNLKEGLLAGEKLQYGLRRLEMAHLEQNRREFEITKHISIRQINPIALLQLRETGSCAFTLPEVLFDMDFPGHYRRRIKSVSISLPCISGPYTGLNATLRLTKNEYRRKADLTEELFSNNVPSTAIAVSTGQMDSGLFELNFRDERYLPFEGAGAISTWELELPEFRQFDYDTISDVVMHVRYTALEEGGPFKAAVVTKVNQAIGAASEGLFAIIDLQHDLPTEWHKAMQHTNASGEHVLSIPDLSRFLPFYAIGRQLEIAETTFVCSAEMTGITPTAIAALTNIELKFKTAGNVVQKAFMVVRFTLS
ncbi:MAG: hypothetical protein H6573_26855 [Lewinellaceae bacterium]|nr:hypothetical protein [Lewinellaceae bacterium]